MTDSNGSHVLRVLQSCKAMMKGVMLLRVQELPGRLWDGKEDLLAALAALCKAAPQAVMSSLQPSAGSRAVVDALVTALTRKKQAYR